MEVCIIGAGASGWMTCAALRSLGFIKKITLIGSPKIPTVGVGESTTETFHHFILKYSNLDNFIRESDATVKYGVYYSGWSEKDFIHCFQSEKPFLRKGIGRKEYSERLANKDPNTFIHDLTNSTFFKYCINNRVCLNTEEYLISWHFNAAKFINFLKKENISDPRVEYISDEVVDVGFISDGEIDYLTLESGRTIKANYYVNSTGENLKSQKLFRQEYVDLSEYLLTNKAIFYPLKYTDKRRQFTPYTITKTMDYGWRWIIPTWSRIGTGYVFSENHITVDQAIEEFKKDIGDDNINPHVVDFKPKAVKKVFRDNYCSIGMSSGFLEPLESSGLSFTCGIIESLIKILQIQDKDDLKKQIDYLNWNHRHIWWMVHLLLQYKTSNKDHTDFWKDQKNVKCPDYDIIMGMLDNISESDFEYYEWEMIFRALASKNINWKSRTDKKPFRIEEINYPTMDHLDFITQFHNVK
mgnify:CR=1 FL=1